MAELQKVGSVSVYSDQDKLEWRLDPTVLSLHESAWRQHRLPAPFCTEVGRRILLAELEFSEWVLRRVEKVQFEQDRSVSRRISIELTVRSDAPVFVDRDGSRHWLVPLSLMRRRTLVNLDLRDEAGESISMLGVRMAQKLDQAVLRAAAAAAAPESNEPDDLAAIDDFIVKFVSGELDQVRRQMDLVCEASAESSTSLLHPLLRDPLFSAVLARLRRNFTLFVLLPVKAGRHRLLRMSFDEPTDWGFQKPTLTRKLDGSYRYRPGDRGQTRLSLHSTAAAAGFRPTRVRFQIPAAENAASYHFEIQAPQGVNIVRATLLAGRPNDPHRHVSLDDVVGHHPIVGLHAVEIPNGSLCRAQIDLRVPTRGWLTTVFLSCWLIFAVLVSVWLHLGDPSQWTDARVTNVVLLLVTVAGGTATFIGHRATGGVAARLVTTLRALGAIAIGLPAIAAAFLVYLNIDIRGRNQIEGSDRATLFVLCVLSLLIVVAITVTYVQTLRDERRSVEQRSPWDMTRDTPRKKFTDVMAAIRAFEFDSAAVAIQSAEGWHERYAWTDRSQKESLAALHKSAHAPEADPKPKTAASCHCSSTCQAASRMPMHVAEPLGCALRKEEVVPPAHGDPA